MKPNHPFRIIAFDWDGTAVENRTIDARPVAGVLEELLKLGVYIVIITGTNFENIDRQFCHLISGPHKRRLFVCANRGSEVFNFNSHQPRLLSRRISTEDEDRILSQTAEAVRQDIENTASVKIGIVYDRLNRRKIDLIPEWPDPPKSEIGELIERTNNRLQNGGFSEGIKGAYELTVRRAGALGLAGARITSDVKNIEVGLTDKSDSAKWVVGFAATLNIAPGDILFLGDEFGSIAGFEGSDSYMILTEPEGVTYVSVGKEPNGVPEIVEHPGGGPRRFVGLMKQQRQLHRKISLLSEPPFLQVQEGYNRYLEREIESLLTVSNGYLGTRGSLEERRPSSDPATLISGVYDKAAANSNEEIIVTPDWLFTRVFVDGKRIAMKEKCILQHKRILDMRKGILRRELRYKGEDGKITLLSYLRFVSLSNPHMMGLRLTVTPENYRGEIRVETGFKPSRNNRPALRNFKKKALDGCGIAITSKTRFTKLGIAEAQISRISEGFAVAERQVLKNKTGISEEWKWRGEIGKRVEIEKIVCVFTSRYTRDPQKTAEGTVKDLGSRGLPELLLEHIAEWEKRWHISEIKIANDLSVQRSINFATYHLVGAGNPYDDKVSISARALTGTIYKGHIFWDTEMFILPFFIFTHPPTAKAILMYRYHTLPAARKKAKSMGFRGALFAWESTITGKEMTPSAILTPTGEVLPVLSGKLEHHIDAAIAHGIWTYWNATLDLDFMFEAGAEILIETARFWTSRVKEQDGEFHIFNVEGPDEYHHEVNDNIYTNMMAAWNLARATEIVRTLRERDSERSLELFEKIKLKKTELARWNQVAENMYADAVQSDGLIEEFDGYFSLQDIDLKKYEPRTAPIDVILGKRKTAACQVVKQADVVMIPYLLEDHFSRDVIEKNFKYYEKRTAHGSSLSPSIYGLVAARLGLTETAMNYFNQGSQIDLADSLGNDAGGIHAAAQGGLWQLIINGFAGIRARSDGLFIHPRLPDHWKRMSFALLWRGSKMGFTVIRGERIIVETEGGSETTVGIFGQTPQRLRPGKSYVSNWEKDGWRKFKIRGK